MRNTALLIGILFLGFFLRVIFLGSAPKGLQADEASFTINTAALIETGMDEDGNRWPVFLKSLIDPKPAVYSYLQIPFFVLLGPTTFASRLPSVTLGVLSLFLAYVLVLRLTKRSSYALGITLVLAFSPWHIMISRATQEVILSFVLIQSILLVLLDIFNTWLSGKSGVIAGIPIKRLIILFILSLLAMYSYHSAKIVLVLFFFGMGMFSVLQQRDKNVVGKYFILFIIVVFAFIITAYSALTRFDAIGLSNYDLPKSQIFEFTTKATGVTPQVLLRAFYNKPVFYGRLFLEQYFSHFSLSYYFTEGGQTNRFRVPAHGLFYLIEIVPMGLGLYHLFSDKKLKKVLPYWLLFLLVSPVAAALTTEEIPSSIRPFYVILPLSLLIVFGFGWICKPKNRLLKGFLLGIITLGYLWCFSYFLQQFFVQMPLWRPWYRSRSYEQAAEYLRDVEDKYEKIIFTNDLREMYIYLWSKELISIQDIQSQPLARYQDSYQIGKFVFSRRHCDTSALTSNSLVIATLGCEEDFVKQGLLLLQTINYDDGVPAFEVYVFDGESNGL